MLSFIIIISWFNLSQGEFAWFEIITPVFCSFPIQFVVINGFCYLAITLVSIITIHWVKVKILHNEALSILLYQGR